MLHPSGGIKCVTHSSSSHKVRMNYKVKNEFTISCDLALAYTSTVQGAILVIVLSNSTNRPRKPGSTRKSKQEQFHEEGEYGLEATSDPSLPVFK